MHPVGVCSGFALRPVGVRCGSALADPDRTPKANPRSGLGPFSVRLGPVGTVLKDQENKKNMIKLLFLGFRSGIDF